MLINLTVKIILQGICISNHHIEHLNRYNLFVNLTSIKLEKMKTSFYKSMKNKILRINFNKISVKFAQRKLQNIIERN